MSKMKWAVEWWGGFSTQGVRNSPPGLENLALLDHLLVRQKVELLEVFTGFELNNKYAINNREGQEVYYAVEDTECCTRNVCAGLRPFEIKVLDSFRTEVIHLHRPLACWCCWCPCKLQSVTVSAPPGTVIGTVEQKMSLWKPYYDIKNAAGDVVLKIKGPCCTCSCYGMWDVEFDVYTNDGGTRVGKISKTFSGVLREVFTDASLFGISFPMDLDIKIKAVCLGACFLIVMTFGSILFFHTNPALIMYGMTRSRLAIFLLALISVSNVVSSS
ncbi:hypothetical protein ABMA28_007087 [Loxostege sticticalis]|uniref:Phospholipid scramblase n=1 Tax=Loxostege sticticalis TaxID=481309 RepID=A0ABD0TPG6_LOXSC